MGSQLDIVDLRHVRDAPAFQHSTHLLEIRGQDIRRFALQQLAKLMPLVMVFARGNGGGSGGGDAPQGVSVFRGNGVFKPNQVERLARPRQARGIVHAVVPVAVDCKVNFCAHRFAQHSYQPQHGIDFLSREGAIEIVQRILGGNVHVKLKRGKSAAFHFQSAPREILRAKILGFGFLSAMESRTDFSATLRLLLALRPSGNAWYKHRGETGQSAAPVTVRVHADAVAVLASQELIDGEVCGLADDIPKRRLHPGDGVVTHPCCARGHKRRAHQAAETVHIAGVFPRQEFIELTDGGGQAGRKKRLAPADQSLVGVDLDDGPIVIGFDDRGFDFSDSHRGSRYGIRSSGLGIRDSGLGTRC